MRKVEFGEIGGMIQQMKVLFAMILLAASVLDKPVSDEQRTKEALAVFTGTVVSAGFDKNVMGNDYYKAVITVESIEKTDSLLNTNPVVVLYYSGTDIKPKQKVKCWCNHWDFDGKRVLNAAWPSWIKKL